MSNTSRNGLTSGGYEWMALSVTTVGALLASVQGSALIIGLPDILANLKADFLTMIWVLLAYLLVTTAVVPVIGRLADMFGRKNLYNAGFAIFTLGSLFAGLAQQHLPRVGPRPCPGHPGHWRRAPLRQQRGNSHGRLPPRSDWAGSRREPDCLSGGVHPRPGGRRAAGRHQLAVDLPRERAPGARGNDLGDLAPA